MIHPLVSDPPEIQKLRRKNKQLVQLVKNAFVEGYSYAKGEKNLWKAWEKSNSRTALGERNGV